MNNIYSFYSTPSVCSCGFELNNMSRFKTLFQSTKCAIIGMIHVKALPGTPRSQFSVQQIIDYACEEANIYKNCGVDGVMVENMFDVPYVSGEKVGPEITAVMTRVCTDVKKIVGSMPCGVQVLSGNNFSAIAVALASGLQFIRAESYVFAHIADEGLMEACAGPLLRYSKNINAEKILILTDIKKKHCSHMITADVNLCQMAKASEFFLSDGVILTGSETGEAPDFQDLKDVKKSTVLPVLIGSGMEMDNIDHFIAADGLIVGSYFKHNGHWTGHLDKNKIVPFVRKVKLVA